MILEVNNSTRRYTSQARRKRDKETSSWCQCDQLLGAIICNSRGGRYNLLLRIVFHRVRRYPW